MFEELRVFRPSNTQTDRNIVILCCSGVVAQLWHKALFIGRILHACWRSRPLPQHILPRFPLARCAQQIFLQQTQPKGASRVTLEQEVILSILNIHTKYTIYNKELYTIVYVYVCLQCLSTHRHILLFQLRKHFCGKTN